MARLEVFGTMGDYPDLAEVADRVLEATWDAPVPRDEYRQKVQQIAQRAVVDHMMREGGSDENPAHVRAVLSDRLDGLAGRIEAEGPGTPHAKLVAADIRRWQARTGNTEPPPMLAMPPGDPIGGSSR
jgi:hypothetical protein